MTECDICKILKHKDAFKLVYEDEICFAMIHESPAVLGHTMVIPKIHATIIEELEDHIAEHLFAIANKVSSAIFDTIGAQGTNILINNGLDAGQDLPHLIVNVLPRKEGDNLNFEWEPKSAAPEELKTTQSMITMYSDHIFSGKDKLPDAKVESNKNDHTAPDESKGHEEKQNDSKKEEQGSHKEHDYENKESKKEEDYMIKALKRTP
jgi:histidine triad (HIT) family protein